METQSLNENLTNVVLESALEVGGMTSEVNSHKN